jgi:hypothetical protein
MSDTHGQKLDQIIQILGQMQLAVGVLSSEVRLLREATQQTNTSLQQLSERPTQQ